MRNKKILLFGLLALAIGFAIVSTTLYINGTIGYSTNKDDFNVIFTEATPSEENKSKTKANEHATAVIESDKKNITFTTQDLAVVGEWARVDYEITNNSRNYDADVTVSWELDDSADTAFVTEYLEIENHENWTGNILASTSETGYIKVSVKKAYLGNGDINDPKEIGFKVTFDADAVSRESLGGIGVSAKDSDNNNLNASAGVISGSKKEKLLNSLVAKGLVENKTDVTALIEVKSDSFEDLATTTFDVSSIASEGDKVVILHYDEKKKKWEYISTEVVDENGKITADFSSYSPVAFVKIDKNGEYKIIYGDNDFDDIEGTSLLNALANAEDIDSGYYNIAIKDTSEVYTAHVYYFDEDQTWNSSNVPVLGDANDVASGTEESQMAKNMVIAYVDGDLTIKNGTTISPYYTNYGGPKGFTIYVTGKLTIENNAKIDNSHGAYAKGQNVYLWKNSKTNDYELIPTVGADGGAKVTVAAGIAGQDGSEKAKRALAGGGSGSARGDFYSGAGGTATSYSGGPGGGGNYITSGGSDASPGSNLGGQGGSAGISTKYGYCGGGGAGNPGGYGNGDDDPNDIYGLYSGQNGTGGLLIIYADQYTNNGTITSNGARGIDYELGVGGSSGGGSINIFTNQPTNINQLGINTNNKYAEMLGNTNTSGGTSVEVYMEKFNGGAGGNGTVNIGSIRDGQYYDLKEIIEQDKEAYLDSLSINGESLLSILGNNELSTGYYNFKVSDETYSVHLYRYDGNQTWNNSTKPTLGNINDVGIGKNEDQMAQNMVIAYVNGDLTIKSGTTISPYYTNYGGPKGFMLYVTGKLTIESNAKIDNSHGAYARGQNVYLWKNTTTNDYELIPAVGAVGGTKANVNTAGTAGQDGTDKTKRALAGGGSGSSRGGSAYSGAGGVATSYSGGTGGGGVYNGTVDGSPGSSFGGQGGAAGKNSKNKLAGGGGAGNPGGYGNGSEDEYDGYNGQNGTGGLLIIYANQFRNNGSLTSIGAQGEVYEYGAGGSSGGGSINIFTNQPTNITSSGVNTDSKYSEMLGTTNTSGGASSETTNSKIYAGAGGTGTVNIGSIRNGQYYDLKDIIEQDKAALN